MIWRNVSSTKVTFAFSAPIIQEKNFKWRVKKDVVDCITHFIMDNCTENTAYGVKMMKVLATGEKVCAA